MAWRRPNTLQGWLSIILRHRKKAFFPAILVMIAAGIFSQSLERMYSARAKLRQQVDTAVQDMNSRVLGRELLRIRSQVQDGLRGQRAVEELILSMPELNEGLTRESSDPNAELTVASKLMLEERVRDLQESIRVDDRSSRDAASLQITVTVTHDDQRLVPQITTKLVDNYIEATKRRLTENLRDNLDYYQKEKTHYDTVVDKFDGEVRKLVRENGDLLSESGISLADRLAAKRDELRLAQNELEAARGALVVKEEYLKNEPQFIEVPTTTVNPRVDYLYQQRAEVQRRIDSHVSLGRKPAHPVYKKDLESLAKVEQEIEQAEREPAVRMEKHINEQREATRLDVRVLTEAIRQLGQEVKKLEDEIDRLEYREIQAPAVFREHDKLVRQLEDARGSQNFWNEKLLSAKRTLEAEIRKDAVRIEMIEAAGSKGQLTEPSFLNLALVALVLGLGTAASMILLAELTDRSYRSIDHAVDDIKLPVLGAVDEIVGHGQVVRQRFFGWVIFPTAAAIMVGVLVFAGLMTYYRLQEPYTFDSPNPIEFATQFVKHKVLR